MTYLSLVCHCSTRAATARGTRCRRAAGLQGGDRGYVALRNPDLLAGEILDGANRLVRHDPRETGPGEPERYPAGVIQALDEGVIHPGTHIVYFRLGIEEQRQAVDVDIRIDVPETTGRKRGAVQLADADLAQHLAVVAHDPAPVELDPHPAVGALGDLRGPFPHGLHPAGILRREGGDLEFRSAGGSAGQQQQAS